LDSAEASRLEEVGFAWFAAFLRRRLGTVTWDGAVEGLENMGQS
jgi:hypothetical protein